MYLCKMKKVRSLTDEEFQELEKAYKTGKKYHFRQRCKGILLSHEGRLLKINKKKSPHF